MLLGANPHTVHSGELAGGGSVAVAVGVSDSGELTGDRLLLTCDM